MTEKHERGPEDVTVLVADDEPDVLYYLSSVLEDAGMTVLTAHNGEEALEILKKSKPDLISLDLVMPRKSGIRVIHELRRNPEWSKIPMVIVTGHAQDRDVRSGLDTVMADSTMSGPSMYLEKPVTPKRYLEHVCQVLGIDLPEDEEAAAEKARLRAQAEKLIAEADADTLQAVLEQLQRQG